MAIAKLLLLLATITAQHFAASPPNVGPSSDELREQKGLEHVVPYFTALLQTFIWTWALIEGAVLFALSGHCPPSLSQPILHFLLPATLNLPATDLRVAARTTPSPDFIAGSLLSICGSLLRLLCYRTLGSRFTFALSIRRDHHALETSGIYAFVRHPSYAGGIALIVGYFMCVFERRGWVVAACARRVGSDVEGVVVQVVLGCIWATLLVLMLIGLRSRVEHEDAMLENHFGDEWRAWAKRVPYSLVPGVY